MSADILTQPVLPLLTEPEARALTDQIKGLAEQIWDLLLEAHDRKAWTALGYITWESYVRAEFDMSRRRSYQILDQGRVIQAIECAAGVNHGTQIAITEREARDINPILPQVVERVREAVANVPQERVAEIVQEVIDKERDKINVFREGREAAKALAEELDLKPMSQEEEQRIDVIYGLYDALKEIEKMPEPAAAASMVKDYERRDLETLPSIIGWLSDFGKAVGVA